MKRTRLTDEQIVGILADHEAGAKCADLCRKHGMSEGTFCNWKAKFGGMIVPEAKRLKALEDENAKLKKLLAEHGLSERRPAKTSAPDRTMIRYRSRRARNTLLRGRLHDLANERRRFGCRRLFVLLRCESQPSGIIRIYRLYREEGLSVRKRRAWRKAVGTRAPIQLEARPNARWSLDFVYDQFACGRRFRVLNVVHDVTQECLAAISDTLISGRSGARGAGRGHRPP